MDVKKLVGSGDRIGLFVLPVVVVGVILNIAFPSVFEVGGRPGPPGRSRSSSRPSGS